MNEEGQEIIAMQLLLFSSRFIIALRCRWLSRTDAETFHDNYFLQLHKKPESKLECGFSILQEPREPSPPMIQPKRVMSLEPTSEHCHVNDETSHLNRKAITPIKTLSFRHGHRHLKCH